MPNATFTSEDAPTGVGPGCRWYQPSTSQWRAYNASTGQWDMEQDGFDSLNVGEISIAGVVGLTGEYEGIFKKVKIENGIIIEFEVE
jgi:hypothetical protein